MNASLVNRALDEGRWPESIAPVAGVVRAFRPALVRAAGCELESAVQPLWGESAAERLDRRSAFRIVGLAMSVREPSDRLLVRRELARLLELSVRAADTSRVELEQACQEAQEQGLFAVCVNSSRVLQAAHFLEDTDVKVSCSVAGFMDADVKRFETEVGVDSGAQIIEVALNIGRLKDRDEACLLRELRDVIEAADERPVGVALELALLDEGELETALSVIAESGAKGVTVNAGSSQGHVPNIIRRVKDLTAGKLGIKVDVAAVTLDELGALLEAGATRFGTASARTILANLR